MRIVIHSNFFIIEPFVSPRYGPEAQTGRRPATMGCRMLGQSHYVPVVGGEVINLRRPCIGPGFRNRAEG
jgi:hypothetical protein